MAREQRTALVTGAASGIGAAIARRFLAAGYRVALFDLNEEGAKEVVCLKRYRERSLILRGDASDEIQVRKAVARAEAEFGSVGVLVNNVGIEINGTVLEQTREHWDRQLAVNLTSVFLFSKYCVPGMRVNEGGAIINISSVHAFASWPRCAAYDATKSGLLGITRAMAVDYGPDGIRVNAIGPGYIRTPLLEQWFASIEDGEQDAIRHHPLRRIGHPMDVANAAFFLASQHASFITGTCLTVDGGLLAAGH